MKQLTFLFVLLLSCSFTPVIQAEPPTGGKSLQLVRPQMIPHNLLQTPRMGSRFFPGRAALEQQCYNYAFISRREHNVKNIFYADTCSPASVRQLTPNTLNTLHYGSLAANAQSEIVAIETDASRAQLVSYLTVWKLNGGGSIPLYHFRNQFTPHYPTWGPRQQFAMVTTNTSGRDPVIRILDELPYTITTEAPPILVSDDSADTRTLGRISWMPIRDTAHPWFNKLIVSVKRGSYTVIESGRTRTVRDDTDRLFVVDAESGELVPLKDHSASSHSTEAIEGKDVAVSPNGNRLVFVRHDGIRDRLWTCELSVSPGMSRNGDYLCGNIRMIENATLVNGNYASPCWSHDNQKIFFSFGLPREPGRMPSRSIYMINPDGSALQRLSSETYDDFSPTCMPRTYEAASTVEMEAVPIEKEEEYQIMDTVIHHALPVRSTSCTQDSDCAEGQVCRNEVCE